MNEIQATLASIIEIAVKTIDHRINELVPDMIASSINEIAPDMIKTISLDIAKRVVEDHCMECGMHRKIVDVDKCRAEFDRAGLPWSDYEDRDLTREVNVVVIAMAKRHGRSITAIRLRVKNCIAALW